MKSCCDKIKIVGAYNALSAQAVPEPTDETAEAAGMAAASDAAGADNADAAKEQETKRQEARL